jgi:predicted transcriptional regulator
MAAKKTKKDKKPTKTEELWQRFKEMNQAERIDHMQVGLLVRLNKATNYDAANIAKAVIESIKIQDNGDDLFKNDSPVAVPEFTTDEELEQ